MIFTFVLGLSVVQFAKFFVWVVFIDCIFVGVCVATTLWAVCNACLRTTSGGGSRAAADSQIDVEWAYCFDVHLNAFFPMLMLLHVLMPVLYIRKSGHCLRTHLLSDHPIRRLHCVHHRQHDLGDCRRLLRVHHILGLCRWERWKGMGGI
jgi:hypothetical protein